MGKVMEGKACFSKVCYIDSSHCRLWDDEYLVIKGFALPRKATGRQRRFVLFFWLISVAFSSK